MLHAGVPCCYFPTTVVFVDDDSIFLEHLPLTLSSSKTSFPQFFTYPLQALEFINASPSQGAFIKRSLLSAAEEDYEHRVIDVSVPIIHHEVFNSQRSKEISVIIVDQIMPQLTGLELCRQLVHPSIKRIMLTGEADEKFAIRAFNEGLIDHFIRKDSETFNDDLNKALETLQYEYFVNLSQIILQSLATDSKRSSPLNDPAFIKFFTDLCRQEHIEEYYLLDISGSFLLVDDKKKLRWLIVKTHEELNLLAGHADAQDSLDHILRPVRQRQSLLYFYDPEDSLAPVKEWVSFMYPVQGTIKGQQDTYYYSLQSQVNAPSFDAHKVALL